MNKKKEVKKASQKPSSVTGNKCKIKIIVFNMPSFHKNLYNYSIFHGIN